MEDILIGKEALAIVAHRKPNTVKQWICKINNEVEKNSDVIVIRGYTLASRLAKMYDLNQEELVKEQKKIDSGLQANESK